MEAEIATAHTGATTTELTEPLMIESLVHSPETEAETEDWLEMYLGLGVPEHAYLWTNMAAEFKDITAWDNVVLEMDEERERSSGRAYRNKEIGDEQLKKLKNRDFDGQDERQEDEEVCSVCLKDLYRGTVTAMDCRHEFHFDCLKRWILRCRNICPLCKATAIRH